ncbi:7244_t:CDS:2 [Entrophospora sp. SA101]|nr:7244_t:CDS:2 [Entrophospora sp. SA101]
MQTFLVEESNSKKNSYNYYDSKNVLEEKIGDKREDYSIEDFDTKEDVVSIHTDSDYSLPSDEEEFDTRLCQLLLDPRKLKRYINDGSIPYSRNCERPFKEHSQHFHFDDRDSRELVYNNDIYEWPPRYHHVMSYQNYDLDREYEHEQQYMDDRIFIDRIDYIDYDGENDRGIGIGGGLESGNRTSYIINGNNNMSNTGIGGNRINNCGKSLARQRSLESINKDDHLLLLRERDHFRKFDDRAPPMMLTHRTDDNYYYGTMSDRYLRDLSVSDYDNDIYYYRNMQQDKPRIDSTSREERSLNGLVDFSSSMSNSNSKCGTYYIKNNSSDGGSACSNNIGNNRNGGNNSNIVYGKDSTKNIFFNENHYQILKNQDMETDTTDYCNVKNDIVNNDNINNLGINQYYQRINNNDNDNNNNYYLEEPSLPYPWELCISSKNKIYYFNTETHESQWTFPSEDNYKKNYDDNNNDIWPIDSTE